MNDTKHQVAGRIREPAAQSSINLGIAVLEAAASIGQPIAPAVALALADVLRGIGAPIGKADGRRMPLPDHNREAPLPLFAVAADKPAAGEAIEVPEGDWLSVGEFRKLFGMGVGAATRILAQCETGQPWHGVVLKVRRVPCLVPAGFMREVLRSTIPALASADTLAAADGSGTWIGTAEFAHRVGIGRSRAKEILARCEGGGTWRGIRLRVRRFEKIGRPTERQVNAEDLAVAGSDEADGATRSARSLAKRTATRPAPARTSSRRKLTARAATPAEGVH